MRLRVRNLLIPVLLLCLLVSGCGPSSVTDPTGETSGTVADTRTFDDFLYSYDPTGEETHVERDLDADHTFTDVVAHAELIVEATFVGYQDEDSRDRMIFSAGRVLKGFLQDPRSDWTTDPDAEKRIIIANEISNVNIGYISGLYRYEPGQTYLLTLDYVSTQHLYVDYDVFLPLAYPAFSMMYNAPLTERLAGRTDMFYYGQELEGYILDLLATDPTELNEPGMLPVVDEPMGLRIAMASSPHILSYSYTSNDLTRWLQDRTNVETVFNLYPEAEARDEMRLDLVTGAYMGDVVHYPQSQLDPADLASFAESGLLLDLTDLLHERGHNFLEMMDMYPASWESVTFPDGGIYALPKAGVNGLYPMSYPMRQWIHTDFLQQYNEASGLPADALPETTEEYRSFLIWCRDNIEGSVDWSGAEDRSIWFARPTDFLMNAFTYQNEDGYYQKDGAVHAAFVEDAYREGLKYLSGLMEDGLMDPEYVSHDENSLKMLVAQNDGYTVASGSWGGMHNAATDHAIRLLYTVVPPLEGPDGFRYAFYDQYAQGVQPSSVFIPANSRNPDLAVAWYDACCDLDTFLRGRYGALDSEWEIPPEGTIAVDGGPAIYKNTQFPYSTPTAYNWFVTNPCLWQMVSSSMSLPQPETLVDGRPIYDLEAHLYEASRLYEPYVVPCDLPGFLFDSGTHVYVDTLKAQIDAKYRSAVTDFIFGTRDIGNDAHWEAYVTEMAQAGLADLLGILQDEFDNGWADAVPEVYTPWPQRTE